MDEMLLDYWSCKFSRMEREAANAAAEGGSEEVFEAEGNIWDEVARWAEEDEKEEHTPTRTNSSDWEAVEGL